MKALRYISAAMKYWTEHELEKMNIEAEDSIFNYKGSSRHILLEVQGKWLIC